VSVTNKKVTGTTPTSLNHTGLMPNHMIQIRYNTRSSQCTKSWTKNRRWGGTKNKNWYNAEKHGPDDSPCGFHVPMFININIKQKRCTNYSICISYILFTQTQDGRKQA